MFRFYQSIQFIRFILKISPSRFIAINLKQKRLSKLTFLAKKLVLNAL
ncbi:phytoene dehydrogenase [Listeria monocytogenes]|nr:phytoene dehydrogenase [Listeria monocytogenes]